MARVACQARLEEAEVSSPRSRLAASGEYRGQLVRWNDFELGIGAVARLLVVAPSTEMRHVPETSALHVLVCDFDNQFGPQRLPRKILALAPAALAAWHAMPGAAIGWSMFRPSLPGVICEGVLPIWIEKLDQLLALLVREAGTYPNVLQIAGIVEEPQQQRSDRGALAFLVP